MAAVKAAVDGIDKITSKQLEFAKDKLLMGTERKSMALTEESRKVNLRLFLLGFCCMHCGNAILIAICQQLVSWFPFVQSAV